MTVDPTGVSPLRQRFSQMFTPGLFEEPVDDAARSARASTNNRSVLSTYRGPGRERVLGVMEHLRMVPDGTTQLAREGASPLDLGNTVRDALKGVEGDADARKTLSMIAGSDTAAASAGATVAGASSAPAPAFVLGAGLQENPVSNGLFTQWYTHKLAQETGLPLMANFTHAGSGTSTSHAVDQVDEASHAASVSPGGSPESAQFIDDAIPAILGVEDESMRTGVLLDAVKRRAAAGGEPLDNILLTSILAGPKDETAVALREALDAASDAVEHGADTGDTLSMVASKSAGASDDSARVAARGVDDAIHIAGSVHSLKIDPLIMQQAGDVLAAVNSGSHLGDEAANSLIKASVQADDLARMLRAAVRAL